MQRSSRWQRGRAAVPWCAALLGALFGGLLARPRAAEACECVPPAWRLTLSAASSDGSPDNEDRHAWPTEARLETYSGTILLWSEGSRATDTIDRLHAGEL